MSRVSPTSGTSLPPTTLDRRNPIVDQSAADMIAFVTPMLGNPLGADRAEVIVGDSYAAHDPRETGSDDDSGDTAAGEEDRCEHGAVSIWGTREFFKRLECSGKLNRTGVLTRATASTVRLSEDQRKSLRDRTPAAGRSHCQSASGQPIRSKARTVT